MRYVGLDLASCSGWALFEDDKLLERGTIQLISGMDLPQKLHYFHLELTNLLTRLQPEYCFIEDVILAISGAKTLAYLARLNGVAINAAFSILQERVKLYDPPYWKSHSYDGLSGMAKKWQIQLAVIKHYNIPITGNFEPVEKTVSDFDNIIDQYRDQTNGFRDESNKLKSKLNLKRNPPTESEKHAIKQQIKELEKTIASNKQTMKDVQKGFDKTMVKMSNDIAAQTGMTENICDACGIAYCGYLEMQDDS